MQNNNWKLLSIVAIPIFILFILNHIPLSQKEHKIGRKFSSGWTEIESYGGYKRCIILNEDGNVSTKCY